MSIKKDNNSDENGRHTETTKIYVFPSSSHSLLPVCVAHEFCEKEQKHPTEDEEVGEEKCMHAECKKRSLVRNLTHEITGTDVADKRIFPY